MGAAGFELPPDSPKNTGNSQKTDAQSGAPIDPDLQTLIDAWPSLSPEQRAAVLRIVQTTNTTAR